MPSACGVCPLYPSLLSISHFSFAGLGGIASPLICQTAISRGIPWDKFYLGSLILSGLNTAFLVITFRPTAREFLRDRREALPAGAAREKSPSNPDTPRCEVVHLPTVIETRNRSSACFWVYLFRIPSRNSSQPSLGHCLCLVNGTSVFSVLFIMDGVSL